MDFATSDDLFIARSPEGDLLPIEVDSALLQKKVAFVPMTYGFIKRQGIDMSVAPINWSDEKKLEVVTEHFTIPDLSDLTLRDVEDRMGPMIFNHLVVLVVSRSIPMIARLQAKDVEQIAATLKDILSKSGTPSLSTTSTPSDTPTPEEEISTG